MAMQKGARHGGESHGAQGTHDRTAGIQGRGATLELADQEREGLI